MVCKITLGTLHMQLLLVHVTFCASLDSRTKLLHCTQHSGAPPACSAAMLMLRIHDMDPFELLYQTRLSAHYTQSARKLALKTTGIRSDTCPRVPALQSLC